jgi:vacuolar-type H+-ATPase catalytic subunit A/Vma1
VFTRWYELDDATALDNALRFAADERKRDQQVLNSRLDLERRERHLKEVYGEDVRRRARHALERAQELERNDEVKQRVVFNQMRSSAVKEEKISLMRQQVRERHFAQRTAEETARLREILDADKDGREEDRLKAKKKRNQPYKLGQLHVY